MSATSDLTVRTSNGPGALPASSEAGCCSPFRWGLEPSLLGLKGTSEFVDACLKFFGNARQYFAAVRRHQHTVLHTYAGDPREIYPRLNRHHHPRLELLLEARTQKRRFMYLQANAMTDAVREIIAETCFCDHAAGSRIDVAGLDTRPNCGDRFELGPQDDRE